MLMHILHVPMRESPAITVVRVPRVPEPLKPQVQLYKLLALQRALARKTQALPVLGAQRLLLRLKRTEPRISSAHTRDTRTAPGDSFTISGGFLILHQVRTAVRDDSGPFSFEFP
jgi:hypothetical protein